MIQVSRADILRLLAEKQEVKDCAELFGYELKPSKKIEFKLPEVCPEKVTEVEEDLPAQVVSSDVDFDYFLLKSEEKQITKQEEVEENIAWLFKEQQEQIPKALVGKEYPKKSRSLFDWQVLRGHLQEMLATDKKRNQVDVKQVVRKISKVETLRTLPKRTKRRQASNLYLIRDHTDERLRPVFRDFIGLSQKLISFFGEHYLREKTLKHKDNLLALLRTHREKRALSYLQGSRAVIILSDLGLYLPNDSVLNQWLAFAQIARAYSCQPIAILPVPAQYLDARVTTAFHCICMESGNPITTKNEPDLKKRQENIAKDREKAKEKLLSVLATSPRIDPHLLRATRDLFLEECNVATEVLAWQHPDVSSNPSFICLRPEIPSVYLAYLNRLKKLPVDKQESTRQNFVDYHGLFYKEKLVLELSLLDSICDFNDELSKYCITEYQNIARRLKENPDVIRRNFIQLQIMQRYVLEQQLSHNQDQVKTNYISVMAALLQQHTQTIDRSLVPFIDKSVVFCVNKPPEDTKTINLLQFSDHLSLVKQDDLKTQIGMLSQGNPIITFQLQAGTIYVETKYKGTTEEQVINLDSDLLPKFPLTNLEQLNIEFIEPERSVFLQITKHSISQWASSISNKQNLTQTASKQKGNYQLQPTIKKIQEGEIAETKSYWYPTTQNPTPPTWASNIDNDAYGLYADLVIDNVRQRFRWIEAGEFWMGSPEKEKDRYKGEVRHKVRLTQSFWLADTACTQALWEAVTGSSTSFFKGSDLPVENVSWHEVKEFIKGCNSLVKGLELRLPTEAEWEYACRAGTETPFAYGEKADSKLMNFNRNFKKTVPVTNLYQNDWGLYQMHGNVWEWCEDWYGGYDTSNEVTVDPRGANTGSYRVLRGGSWGNVGWYCRSAYRSHNRPSNRNYYCGFRLISGHPEKTE